MILWMASACSRRRFFVLQGRNVVWELIVPLVESFFFFFQAEDGIRDLTVTGVQTCALPICEAALSGSIARRLLEQVRDGSGRESGVPDAIASTVSARELEVLLLLDEHLGTDEIAKRLFISEHTVPSHVKSLLRKLGVCSRREAPEQLAVARVA